jgi:hypothetical protein
MPWPVPKPGILHFPNIKPAPLALGQQVPDTAHFAHICSTPLPPSREGTSWLNILKTLVGYQLISPGSEWRLHRHWFEHSAMGDLLGEDITLVQPNNLYRCLE